MGLMNKIDNMVYEIEAKKLTYQERLKIPDKYFAIKNKDKRLRKYPEEDINHARNALVRVSTFGTPEQKAAVYKLTKRLYPGLWKRHLIREEARRRHIKFKDDNNNAMGRRRRRSVRSNLLDLFD